MDDSNESISVNVGSVCDLESIYSTVCHSTRVRIDEEAMLCLDHSIVFVQMVRKCTA